MTDGGTWEPPQPDAPVEPARPGRGRGPVIVAVVGAVALIAAGVFAVSRVVGNGSDGGAETPEAAGRALLAALEQEDVLGVIDLLLPGERDTLREPMVELVSELQRIEVLSGNADLAGITGVDVQFSDESVDVAATNVEDIVNLTISASGSGSIDGEALPIGDLLLDQTGGSPSELTTEAPPPEAFTLPMTAVREDGRWYLSGFFTIAELARQEMPDAPDVPAEGIVAVGGDSPEDAMDNLLDGLEALDLEGIIASLNPDEFQALQRYAPLFLADGQAALDDAQGALTIDDPEYTVSGSGDRRSLTFSFLRVAIDVEGDPGTVTFADGCWTVEARGDVLDACDLEANMPQLDEMFADAQPIEDLLSSFQGTFADYENPGFIVEQVDGRWFVSPMATVFDQLLSVVRALDRAEIEDLQTAVQDVIAQFESGALSPLEPIDEFAQPDDPAVPTTVAAPDDTTVDPAEGCYQQDEALAAAECFELLVADGSIEEHSVPFFLRFPDCGLAEVGWSGDYYVLADDDFVAIVNDTAPCFQEKVVSGEAERFELPAELLRPECLEGRNPYNALDDESYTDAYDACAYG